MKRLLLLFLAALVASTVAAFAEAPDAALRNGVVRAADLQLSRQGTWANGDAGSGSYLCSWEWEIGSTTAYANTQGPSVLGLLAAYATTDNQAYLAGAVCAGDQMVARGDASTKRPYADDVIFLSELSEATGNELYRERAETYHARTRARFVTGTDMADYYITQRLSLSGWDLSAQIEAALAVGQEDYARAIALQLITRRADWEGVPYYDGTDYTLLSRGTLVGALADLEGETIKAYRDESRRLALSLQDTDGSWEGDFQTTAYVLTGLETSQRSAGVQRAIAGGVKYLLSTETPHGGWSYPPEFAEVNGEVLSALAPLVQSGRDDDLDWGREFRDPTPHGEHGHARPHRGED